MSSKAMSAEDVKGKLLQGAFQHKGSAVSQLSDPIADTPMVVTLDQLRPYDHNPRLNRNPIYDQLKESIRSRGLDAPPAITRRPGETNYLIRNGGNTRLAILNELWAETRDEQYWKIHCLYRPWAARGEIIALTGHLAENDMHGALTFVERALGIDRAREFYEQEGGKPLSQRDLSRRLAEDGYPVSQPHISKMQDTVQFLLPAIPKLLYAGLGKPQIERLTALRRSAEKTWRQHAGEAAAHIDFDGLFQDVLASFDDAPDFTVERFQDELIHQMQQPLGKDYNWLKLDMLEARGAAPEPVAGTPVTDKPRRSAAQPTSTKDPTTTPEPLIPPLDSGPDDSPHPLSQPAEVASEQRPEQDSRALIDAHVISPIVGLTPRIQAMKQQLAKASGEPLPDFAESCLQAIPVQVGGLHPVSDLWYIERQIDTPDELRLQICGLVHDIAQTAQLQVEVYPATTGTGYALGDPDDVKGRSVLVGLLHALGGQPGAEIPVGAIAALLIGAAPQGTQVLPARLDDETLVKLFRVIRLARRLADLEAES
ncbi:ParB family protein [Pseudomonas sp. LJDD11]|uniref:ParB family protein n=1 Tax=Pseudomonas sp. LJDD11 TaxID=2931984 RepID=UPI00211BC047|nr:ParB family protein [Pseudomonas sp. LJDD11]MCQ9422298.1 ParB family protein [Pseudomonas sp. LJDD11]